MYKTECQVYSNAYAHALTLKDIKMLGMVLRRMNANSLGAGKAPRL